MPQKWFRMFVYEGEFYDTSSVDVDANGKPNSDGYELYEIADPIALTPNDLRSGYGQMLPVLLNTNQARRI